MACQKSYSKEKQEFFVNTQKFLWRFNETSGEEMAKDDSTLAKRRRALAEEPLSRFSDLSRNYRGCYSLLFLSPRCFEKPGIAEFVLNFSNGANDSQNEGILLKLTNDQGMSYVREMIPARSPLQDFGSLDIRPPSSPYSLDLRSVLYCQICTSSRSETALAYTSSYFDSRV